VAVIIAVGVNSDGRREVLGLDIGPSEAETFWTEFLRKLARRGVKLVISDAHEGLKAAITKVLHATWRRCRVHLMRNLLPTSSLHDPGNHRPFEPRSHRQAVRRDRLTKPACPAGERDIIPALTTRPGARSKIALPSGNGGRLLTLFTSLVAWDYLILRFDTKCHKQFVAKQHTARSSQQSRISSKTTDSRTKGTKTQYAALPYHLTKARGIEFLPVTSREDGPVDYPEGLAHRRVETGQGGRPGSLRRAGVRDIVSTRTIGEYSYTNEYRALCQILPCKITVFALLVSSQQRTWPEAHQRRSGIARERQHLS
jgi:Transposase, Mutator family